MSEELKEAILYLEHTSKDDFNLEEHQKENRIWAIKILLDYIEQLQQEIKELKENDNVMTKAWKNNIHRVRQLENILNELESWLEEQINNDAYSPYDGWDYQWVLDKLKELKGSDK